MAVTCETCEGTGIFLRAETEDERQRTADRMERSGDLLTATLLRAAKLSTVVLDCPVCDGAGERDA